MGHVYHAEIWECNGKWLCGDVSALAACSNYCWYPAFILDLSPVDFVKLLISKYHAVNLSYKAKYDVLIYYFSTIEDARKYKNDINKAAKLKNFINYEQVI